MREAGGWLTEADLAAFTPEWREPVTITYRGHEVSSVPPPFSAFQMLETLEHHGGLRRRAAGATTPPSYLHHLIEAIKLASADRLAYAYLDDVPRSHQRARLQGLRGLAARAHRPRARGGERGRAAHRSSAPGQISEGHPADFMHEQTTHFACADAEGTVVSVTQTLGVPFGSGFAVPGTGLVLNNILKWMDLDPASPNAVRPGKKAGTMMSPTQVFRDGAFTHVHRHAGLVRHPADPAQMLLNVLEFGINIQEAIEAPRMRVYATG